MSGKKITEKEFIERCKRFNPQFSYREISFTKLHGGYVYPICKKHGKFRFNAVGISTKPIKCPECDRIDRFNSFVEKARKVHEDKYGYIENSYSTNKKPMTIVCPVHGEFQQAPSDHLKGWGCSKCSKKYKPTTEEWINRVAPLYNYRFDYSKVNYIDNKTNVVIICPEHGEFLVTPSNHIKGNGGCPKCAGEWRHKQYSYTTEEFITKAKEVHGNKYDYSKVNYYNNKTEVTIICPKHGEFNQMAGAHLQGTSCPKCNLVNQNRVYEKLKETFTDTSILWEYSPQWLGLQRFDIYFPEYNIAVEYDGIQHYKPIEFFGGKEKFELVQKRDKLKENKVLANKCILFRLKYSYTKEDLELLICYIQNFISKSFSKGIIKTSPNIQIIYNLEDTLNKENQNDKN